MQKFLCKLKKKIGCLLPPQTAGSKRLHFVWVLASAAVMFLCLFLPAVEIKAADTTAEVKGTVNWETDIQGNRPSSVTLHLYQNGTDTGKTVTASSSGKWAFTFGQMPVSDSGGNAYTYSVVEDAVKGGNDTYDISYASKYVDPSKFDQLKLTFDSSSRTESTSYDWVQIYYKDSAGNIKVTNKYGGTSIADASVVIPYGDCYVYFRSDSSSTYYGFKFSSIAGTTGETLTSVSSGTLPNYTATEKSETDYPETSHNYSNNQNLLWHYTPSAQAGPAYYSITVTNKGHYIGAGTWGTCPWTIDVNGVLTIGAGTGAEQSSSALAGPWNTYANQIKSIAFSGKVIAPSNSRFLFSNLSNVTKVTNAGNFDTGNVTNMSSMFDGCSRLTTIDVSGWNTGNVKDMSFIFNLCSALTTLDVSKWNTSNATNMKAMFQKCVAVTTLDTSKWNTSKVTNMAFMFFGCSALTTIDVSEWNTSNITDMNNMFYGCSALTTLDVSGWNTGNVKDMSFIFNLCSALTTLDVSKWNTSNATNMKAMFQKCSALTTLDVSGWDTGNVRGMSWMFTSCPKLATIYAGSGWNTDKVTSSSGMFYDDTSLTGGAGTKYSSSHVDKTYAHIDGGTSNPGYFTSK